MSEKGLWIVDTVCGVEVALLNLFLQFNGVEYAGCQRSAKTAGAPDQV